MADHRRWMEAGNGGPEDEAALVALRLDIRAARLGLAALRVLALLLKANFDPAQPRIPRGQPGGGRWTDGDDALLAQAPAAPGNERRYLVDLRNHEGGATRPGHTISRHVGKTDAYLLRRMQTENVPGLFYSVKIHRASTFLA